MATWDNRLITPEGQYRLIAEWPVYFDVQTAELSQFEQEGGGAAQADQVQGNLRCGHCGQSCAMIPRAVVPVMASMGDLAAGVLRHMVMAHDVPLSGANGGGRAGS